MKKIGIAFGGLVLILLIVVSIVFAADIRGAINTWRFGIQKVDDHTNYNTIKMVEDTCRSMIASYNADKLKYEQYKESEHAGWAEQAKMRANNTASTYNNYMMKNSFVWKENIPADIYTVLEYLD